MAWHFTPKWFSLQSVERPTMEICCRGIIKDDQVCSVMNLLRVARTSRGMLSKGHWTQTGPKKTNKHEHMTNDYFITVNTNQACTSWGEIHKPNVWAHALSHKSPLTEQKIKGYSLKSEEAQLETARLTRRMRRKCRGCGSLGGWKEEVEDKGKEMT